MEQGKSLGGAEAGLAGGTADKLRDASALLTEHGMLPSWKEGGMNWLRSSEISPCLRSLFLCFFPDIQEDGSQVPGAGHLLW